MFYVKHPKESFIIHGLEYILLLEPPFWTQDEVDMALFPATVIGTQIRSGNYYIDSRIWIHRATPPEVVKAVKSYLYMSTDIVNIQEFMDAVADNLY